MAIDDVVRKKIWAASGNVCAFPGCSLRVARRVGPNDQLTVVGDECHIVARKPGFTRGPNTLSDEDKERWKHLIEDRDGYENLVVMCRVCHKVIDDKHQGYTVEQVVKMKRRHEAVHLAPAAPRRGVLNPFGPEDEDPLPVSVRRVLNELQGEDERLAHQLDGFLGSNGKAGLVAAVEREDDWIAVGDAAQWSAVGAVCAAFGLTELAEQCFLRAAEHEDEPDPRQYINASGMAVQRGEEERATSYFEKAVDAIPDDPLVKINQARMTPNPDEGLEALAAIACSNERDEALRQVTIAQRHLAKGDLHEARRGLYAAEVLPKKNEQLKWFDLHLRVAEAAEADADGKPVEGARLRRVAAKALVLADEQYELGKHRNSGMLRNLAADALRIAGEREDGLSILTSEAAKYEASLIPDIAIDHGQLALRLAGSEVALALLPGDSNDEVIDSLRSAAETFSDDPDERGQALVGLEEKLASSDERVRINAANSILSTAASEAGAEWSEDAERILTEKDAERVAILRGLYLDRNGDPDGAEQALLRAKDHEQSLRLRSNIAGRVGNTAKAALLAERLTRVHADPAHVQHLAHCLRSDGKPGAAFNLYLSVARNQDAPRRLRQSAYASATQMALDIRDPSLIVPLAAEWQGIDPDGSDPGWAMIFGFALAGDTTSGLQLLEDGLAIDDEHRAEIASGVYVHELPPAEAIMRIDELSQRFDRSSDLVEFRIICAGLMSGEKLEDPALSVMRQALEGFFDRFPESTLLIRVPAPKDLEELNELAKRFGRSAEHVQAIENAINGVDAGSTAVAIVAALANDEVCEVWSRLANRPMVYPDRALLDEEISHAEQHLGMPVCWDSTALHVVASLPETIADKIMAQLDQPLMTSSTRQDVVRFSPGVTTNHDEVGTLVTDENGRAVLYRRSPAELRREREIAERMTSLVAGFNIEGDTSVEGTGNLEQLLKDNELAESVASMLSTIALAQRKNTAVFSDDRVVRMYARSVGVPAFGTVALIMALAGAGKVDPVEARGGLQSVLEPRLDLEDVPRLDAGQETDGDATPPE